MEQMEPGTLKNVVKGSSMHLFAKVFFYYNINMTTAWCGE